MPEGDTVWRAAQNLTRALAGLTLTRSDFRVPSLATADLSGERIGNTRSVGKHLLTELGSHTLHTHFKMEGSWHLYRPATAWRRPDHQARVVLTTAEWIAVGFSLGVVELVAQSDAEHLLDYLGPDVLGPDWDAQLAVENLKADSRTIGEALLDQRNLAGIGNIYRNELCFLIGVRPTAAVSAVPDLNRLTTLAKSLLEANKHRVEQTTTGNTRRGQQTWVFRRENRPCRRCGTRIRTGSLGPAGQERTIWWCPSCQTE